MRFLELLPAMTALAPLSAGWLLSRFRPGTGAGRRLLAGAPLVAFAAVSGLWVHGRVGSSGTFDGDPLSLYLSGLILAALAIAALLRSDEVEALARLQLGGAVAILAVSTRDLVLSVVAIQLFLVVARDEERRSPGLLFLALVSLASLGVVAGMGGGTDLAVIASSDSLSALVPRAALALLVGSLLVTWLVENRRTLRFSRAALSTRMASSFVLLVAVVSVLLRIAAWIPEAAPYGAIRVLGLGALGAGALGMLASTRLSTWATALSLARAGLVALALLGGVQGRAPLLVELATTGVTLLLVAFALEKLVGVDDVSSLGSFSSRLSLVVGASTAASLPPFPGFVAKLPLAHALLSEEHALSLVLAGALTFLVGVGSMRLVARAFSQPAGSSSETKEGALAAALFAFAALWLLGLAPSRFLQIAARAATGIF